MSLTDKRYFYHDTGGKPPADTEIVFQKPISYGKIELECLNGLELKPQRGIEFRVKDKAGNNHYYVTKAAAEKLQEKYKWAWRLFWD